VPLPTLQGISMETQIEQQSNLDIIMSRLATYEGSVADDAHSLINSAEIILGHSGRIDDDFLSDMATELGIDLAALLEVEAN